MSRELKIYEDFFLGKRSPALPATVVDGPWAKADTSAAGSPTVTTAGGFLQLTLDNTNEVQNLCVYHGDILGFDIDDLVFAEFWAKVTASLPAEVTAVIGLGSARNDTPDTVAANAWFRLQGNNTLLCESDDGTNDNDDKSTGLTLSTTVRKLRIDFAEGIKTVSGGASSGGKADVKFSAENAQGLLRPLFVNTSTTFDMSNYAAGLQPYFQLQKTAAASVATLSIQGVRIGYRIGR